MFSFRRNRMIQSKIDRYLAVCSECMDCFRRGLDHYLHHGIDTHFAAIETETHEKESDADSVRDEIEIDLYEQSLLPESREDLLLLLEHVDLLPNQAEKVLRLIKIEQLQVPEFIHGEMAELADIACRAFDLIIDGIGDSLAEGTRVREINRQLDELESVGDKLERQAVTKLFASELPTGDRLLYRDIVFRLGALGDLAEDVGQFLTIFTVKRSV